MTTKIVVPQLGESVVEATVGTWLKQEGDTVAVGDVLVELQTDKVDVEIGAETAGVLAKIERQEGEDVVIGDVLGHIEENGAAAPASSDTEPAAEPQPAAVEKPAAPPPSKDGERITPVARRMAQEQGIDVTQISGSGRSGRVTKQDVQSHIAQKQAPAQPQAATP